MSTIATKPGKRRKEKEPPPRFADTPEGCMERALYELRGNVAAYEERLARIAEGESDRAKLEKEVADYLESIDLMDAEAVGLIATKQDQLRLLPKFIVREEERQSERGDALASELVAVAESIQACAQVEVETALATIEAAIRPWFPPYMVAEDRLHGKAAELFDPARSMAARSALVSGGIHEKLSPALEWLPPQSSRILRLPVNVASYDRDLLGRAKVLLGIHQEWQNNGRFFCLASCQPSRASPTVRSLPPSPRHLKT